MSTGVQGGRLPEKAPAPANGVAPDALRRFGPKVVVLAETEGLPAHAESVRRRLAALDDDRRDAP